MPPIFFSWAIYLTTGSNTVILYRKDLYVFLVNSPSSAIRGLIFRYSQETTTYGCSTTSRRKWAFLFTRKSSITSSTPANFGSDTGTGKARGTKDIKG